MSDPENNIKSKTYEDPIDVTNFYVRYAETDAMRVVHHAAYLVYFEEGRSQLMRNLGRDYADIEASGFMLPVTEVNVRYVGSLVYGNQVKISTRLTENRSRRVTFTYEVRGPESDDVLVSGYTRHIWTDSKGAVTRVPEQWQKLFEK
jgi:acyl-CoA thioester hydrolase